MNRIPSSALFLCCAVAASCEAQDPRPNRPASRPASAPASRPTGQAAGRHAAFDALLRATVRDERVDYLAVRDRHHDRLTAYLDELAGTEPRELPENERLAYYINLYNATMIAVVCQRLRAGYRASDGDWTVFKEPLVRIGDERISLNHLENEIIRVQFDEPRIHVALVCGARSCPPILDRAYTAQDLETLLEANMRRFLNDTSRNRIGARRVELSQIFNWYKDDFGGDAGLLPYVSRYVGRDLSGAVVEFLEYSWDLNIARPSGRWVRLKAGGETAGMKAGEILEVLEEHDGRLRLRKPFGRGEIGVAARDVAPYDGA